MDFFGLLFRNYRESKGLTLQEVAERVGVSKQTVSKWEKGVAKPLPGKVKALARIIGCSVVDISDLQPEDWLVNKPDTILPNDAEFVELIEIWKLLNRPDQLRLLAYAHDLIGEKRHTDSSRLA